MKTTTPVRWWWKK